MDPVADRRRAGRPIDVPYCRSLLAVAAAAKELDEKRRLYLDPPGETNPAVLKERTLTKLYNERPTWLANLHGALDRAVWAAYGWEEEPAQTNDETILARLLELNRVRSVPKKR